ncbi:hypothetical protein MKW94_009546 [Papaver nudicaule]|uniref:Phytocyanin domain-containing protein n=1 Tax=Papaver nudicaule TaxID=74823 RepID=A0AA41RXA3_PAPNU|nr:hypothetical protein [Papaver nudicaule]
MAVFSANQGIILLLALVITLSYSSMLAFGFHTINFTSPAPSFNHRNNRPRTINVGGSENWRFGFNYTEWSVHNGPFFVKDTLVFKYEAPNATTPPHSVYLFSDYWSYMSCNLKRAKMVGNIRQGSGKGFKFVLQKFQPYFFACGEHGGGHCNTGMMKFAVVPFPRWNNGY